MDMFPDDLNASEKKWIKKAQKLFAEAPDRFDFLTIGDRELRIVDAEFAKETDMADGGATEAGIVLGCIYTKGLVHGVSG